ncbi:hypothetical protein TNCV_805181 [Trichonephila clavipes]|nr:hypothetical protein TNCV_805181 [Trichonephila clavipes]
MPVCQSIIVFDFSEWKKGFQTEDEEQESEEAEDAWRAKAFILPAPDNLEPSRSMGGQGRDVTSVGAPPPLEYIPPLFFNSFEICPFLRP